MHRFDPSQPHGQVCGGAVRLWEQNGIIFDVNHKPVEVQPDGSIKPLMVVDKAQAEPAADGYSSKSTEELKQLCVVYDIKYENRQQAIKALEGA